MNNNTVISISNLTKEFSGKKAVDEISLEIKRGEIFGFLGPNGAGKSTTIRMLCGILKPTSGKGDILGLDIYTQAEEIKKNIGYIPNINLMLDVKNGDYIKERICPEGIIHANCLKSCVNPCRVCRNNRTIALDELGKKESLFENA